MSGMGVMRHMDQIFLKRVSDAIDRNIEDEAFGIADLCKELGVSRSKLHRKLKSLSGKSASQFIREFRLNRARDMLRDNIATTAEIAYSVGFGSPSYFSTSFHNYFGYSPSEVKNQDSSSFDARISTEITGSSQGKSRLKEKRTIVLFLLGLAVLIAALSISYSLKESSDTNRVDSVTANELSRKSIVIFPFDVLSDEKQDEYFSLGLMASIQSDLSKINGLTVISKQSVEKFIGSGVSPSNISEELNIDYLLTGTIAKQNDSARIIVSLLDAPQDAILISMVFDKRISDILSIQTDVTQSIAEELEMTISSDLDQPIENEGTQNVLAHEFFLKGNDYLETLDRHFQAHDDWMRQLDSAQSFFELALEQDSLFADAYAGKARVSFERDVFQKRGEDNYLEEVLAYANKAISINPNLYSGYYARTLYYYWTDQIEHAIKDYERMLGLVSSEEDEIQLQLLGYLTFYFDFAESIKVLGEMEKNAISDDDFLELYYKYFWFYGKLDDPDKQIYYYKKVLELTDEPKISPWWIYFRTQEFDKAISCVLDFYPNNNQTRNLLLANIYNQKGDLDKAVEYYEKWFDLVEEEGKNNVYSARDLHRYGQALVRTGRKEKGMQLIQQQIDINSNLIRTGQGENALCYDLAGMYSFLNRKEEAFYWMGMFADKNAWFETIGAISFVKFDNQFENIREEQKFKDWVRHGEAQFAKVRNDVSKQLAFQKH